MGRAILWLFLLIFAILVILGVLGWVLVLILVAIRKRLVFWSADNRRSGS